MLVIENFFRYTCVTNYRKRRRSYCKNKAVQFFDSHRRFHVKI